MNAIATSTPQPARGSLAELGLSMTLVHESFRRGFSQALGRTRAANPGAQSNDIYQSASEDLRLRLGRQGWLIGTVRNQRRVVNPGGTVALVVASAIGVGQDGVRLTPTTRPKGRVTHDSIRLHHGSAQGVFDLDGVPALVPDDIDGFAAQAPLWFLLHELVENTLHLECAEPVDFEFDAGPEPEIDVPVELRR
jgi:hypothetical protein